VQEDFMSRDRYDDDVRSLVWFMAGMGVGAAVALLYAPRTGKETRKIITKAAGRGREFIEDQAEAVKERAGAVRERAADLGADLRDRSRDLYERGRDLAKDAGEDAATLLDRGKKIVRG
jgi:gas vesicle protein